MTQGITTPFEECTTLALVARAEKPCGQLIFALFVIGYLHYYKKCANFVCYWMLHYSFFRVINGIFALFACEVDLNKDIPIDDWSTLEAVSYHIEYLFLTIGVSFLLQVSLFVFYKKFDKAKISLLAKKMYGINICVGILQSLVLILFIHNKSTRNRSLFGILTFLLRLPVAVGGIAWCYLPFQIKSFPNMENVTNCQYYFVLIFCGSFIYVFCTILLAAFGDYAWGYAGSDIFSFTSMFWFNFIESKDEFKFLSFDNDNDDSSNNQDLGSMADVIDFAKLKTTSVGSDHDHNSSDHENGDSEPEEKEKEKEKDQQSVCRMFFLFFLSPISRPVLLILFGLFGCSFVLSFNLRGLVFVCFILA